jgi:hypothetical protein
MEQLSYSQLQDRKVEWQRGRKDYLDEIRKKAKKNAQVLRSWSDFTGLADAITATSGQDTVAVGVDHVHKLVYIGVQEGAEVDLSKLKAELHRIGGFGYTSQLVGGGQSGLHGEMQIVKYFLDQGAPVPRLHFAANGKGCCRCCAGLISALDGSYESIETSPYEYLWLDPYYFHQDLNHPIFGQNSKLIAAYGKDRPDLR